MDNKMHEIDFDRYAYGVWRTLMFAFYRLSKWEENMLASKFGHAFYDYKNQVPAFSPFSNKQNKIEFNKSLKYNKNE